MGFREPDYYKSPLEDDDYHNNHESKQNENKKSNKKCDYCGNEIESYYIEYETGGLKRMQRKTITNGFECKRCGELHCGKCRLPENHNCISLHHNRHAISNNNNDNEIPVIDKSIIEKPLIEITLIEEQLKTNQSIRRIFIDELNSTTNMSKRRKIITDLSKLNKEILQAKIELGHVKVDEPPIHKEKITAPQEIQTQYPETPPVIFIDEKQLDSISKEHKLENEMNVKPSVLKQWFYKATRFLSQTQSTR